MLDNNNINQSTNDSERNTERISQNMMSPVSSRPSAATIDVTSDPLNVRFLETKKSFKIMFSIFTLVVGYQLGYIFMYTNTCISVFNLKFGWTTSKQQDIYGAVIGSACSIAIVFGSIYTSFILSKGRRRALNISAFIAMVGVAIQCIGYFPCILGGRLIYGFGVGITTVAFPRYMEETVPTQDVGKFGGLYCLSFAFAQMIGYAAAAFLPPYDDTEALATTHVWQFIFGMPLFFYVIQLSISYFYIPYESPKFYVTNGNQEQGLKVIELIYQDKNTKRIYDYIDRHCERNTAQVTLSQAFTDRRFKKATSVSIWTMIFHEITGFNVIMLYSSTIFESLTAASGHEVDPRIGNYILGGWNFFSAALSLYTAKAFRRRTLLVWGSLLLTICHVMVGIFTQIDMPLMSFIMILMFIFFMQTTSMAVSWLYCSEISTDIAMSYVSIIGFFSIFILTIISPLLMDSAIQQQGTFWLFGLFCLIATVYFYIVIKETSHLDDKGKKQLYMPEDLRNLPEEVQSTNDSQSNEFKDPNFAESQKLLPQ